MRMISSFGKFLFALAMLGVLPSLASGQDPKTQIKAEIDRLQQSLRAKPISIPEFSSLGSDIDKMLQDAAGALDSGKLYLSMEKLVQAEDLFQGARVTEEKSAAVKSGLPAFEAEWENASRNLAAVNQE